jgi:L-asparaginase II
MSGKMEGQVVPRTKTQNRMLMEQCSGKHSGVETKGNDGMIPELIR